MADDRAYRISVAFNPERERFSARVPELGIDVEGESRQAAVEAAERGIEAKFEATAVEGAELPPPADADPVPAELTLILAPQVYRELAHQARLGRTTVEQLAAQLVALGASGAAPARAPRPTETQRPQRAAQGDGEQPPRRDAGDRGGGNDRGGNRAGRSGGANQNRRREGYRPELEDKANFLAYVREMEKGGGRGGGGGGRR